jgi:hypothetical protein
MPLELLRAIGQLFRVWRKHQRQPHDQKVLCVASGEHLSRVDVHGLGTTRLAANGARVHFRLASNRWLPAAKVHTLLLLAIFCGRRFRPARRERPGRNSSGLRLFLLRLLGFLSAALLAFGHCKFPSLCRFTRLASLASATRQNSYRQLGHISKLFRRGYQKVNRRSSFIPVPPHASSRQFALGLMAERAGRLVASRDTACRVFQKCGNSISADDCIICHEDEPCVSLLFWFSD